MSDSDKITIVTFKWATEMHKKKRLFFSAEHVNRLYNSIKRNTTVEFDLVCYTDDAEGIAAEVKCLPLPFDKTKVPGCFGRLKMFREDLPYNRVLWIDLDVVIMGNIDHILNPQVQFKMAAPSAVCHYNGSLCYIERGAKPEVWQSYRTLGLDRVREIIKMKRFVGTDQAWISYILGDTEAKYTGEADGVWSFPIHIHQKRKKEPPPNACIILFPGSHDPSQQWVQQTYPWIKKNWR
jgi:hypothetical protein